MTDTSQDADKLISCPHCQKQFGIGMVASFKETIMTIKLTVQDGHMLQVGTLGSVLTNMGIILRGQAKHIGGDVEALIKDIRCTPKEIAIDLLICSVHGSKKRHKREVKP